MATAPFARLGAALRRAGFPLLVAGGLAPGCSDGAPVAGDAFAGLTPLAYVPKHDPRPPESFTLEVRAGEGGGPDWISPMRVRELSLLLGTLWTVEEDQRINAAAIQGMKYLQGRLPSDFTEGLETLAWTAGPSRSAAAVQFVQSQPLLLLATCGVSPQELFGRVASLPADGRAAGLFEGCDLGRFGLMMPEDFSKYFLESHFAFVELDRHAGAHPLEVALLREMMQRPASRPWPYEEKRARLFTSEMRRGPSPQPAEPFEAPRGATVQSYESDDRELGVWVWRPEGVAEEEKRPALVYLHGGFALGGGDFDDAKQAHDAGFVVVLPTWRGENGNLGNFELMLGEVDDAAAAIRWTAQQPGVDPARVYAFGHSAGGALALLVTLLDDVPLQHSGSASGVFSEQDLLELGGVAPFEPRDREHTLARTMFGHFDEMKHPHFAWLGANDAMAVNADMARSAKPGEMYGGLVVPAADHATVLAPALAQYLACIDTPDKCAPWGPSAARAVVLPE